MKKSTAAELDEARQRTFADVAILAGMTCAKLGQRFDIPRRTSQQWATGERTPPTYLLMMMQEVLGLIKR